MVTAVVGLGVYSGFGGVFFCLVFGFYTFASQTWSGRVNMPQLKWCPFSKLSRKHRIKVGARSVCSKGLCDWEEITLAVGDIPARMNVVLFLEGVDQEDKLVEGGGVTVNGLFKEVLLLTQPAIKITLSNVPPFKSHDFLVKELCQHGRVISPIRKEPVWVYITSVEACSVPSEAALQPVPVHDPEQQD